MPPVISKLQFLSFRERIPMYRAMDLNGEIIDEVNIPAFPKEKVQEIYKNMLTVNIMDQILYETQRQGRISFYMTSFGEEATIGTALALDKGDIVYSQYREVIVFLERGFSVEQMMHQCFSNVADFGKGRQMPIHYGSKDLGLMTISSPLTTQVPQAAGTAYALKREGKGKCVLCFFGEGAASEGDFHAGLNFAAERGCPVIFYCRNNGYAISTPSTSQYKGDGIASRGEGYGIKTVRVDGNDVWAVYMATKMAREYAVENNQPVLIEAMTYRVSNHSTSDDSTSYRSNKEVEDWTKRDNPVARLRRYMESNDMWSNELEADAIKLIRKRVLDALTAADKMKKPKIDEMYSDVYDHLPKNLEEQREETRKLISKYPDYYKINEFES
ncbi:hypothetical protein BB560_006645 [Smittium megazygosporum]|uniref:2-oxoisovalerate dehydrogenase subunit alpha n=1 Tax=Smittium megazygosporum TaxID=133381 RepID=A0A2T9Y2R5_9FUNG|nr:hypothetical protein BB560_006645 [Smittium megazygosporum]